MQNTILDKEFLNSFNSTEWDCIQKVIDKGYSIQMKKGRKLIKDENKITVASYKHFDGYVKQIYDNLKDLTEI